MHNVLILRCFDKKQGLCKSQMSADGYEKGYGLQRAKRHLTRIKKKASLLAKQGFF